MSPRKLIPILLAAVLSLSGCGAQGSPTTVATQPESTTTTSTLPDTVATNVSQVEQLAVEDLAVRLGASVETITVVKSEAKTWSDGSLGCPQPGVSYTQAIVDGFQVALRHGDRLFDYHAGENGEPFLCASSEKDGGHDFVPPPGFND